MGHIIAPKDSTAMLHFNYTAHFGAATVGLWRSAPFAVHGDDDGGGDLLSNQEVLLTTQAAGLTSRYWFPCLDDAMFKVGIVTMTIWYFLFSCSCAVRAQ